VRPIVIVEDNPAIAAYIDEVLREEGYLTHICSNGANGLVAIAQRAPSLVLLDLHLPDMTGMELLAQARQALGLALPIVMMTASTEQPDWRSGGATAFLSKPFSIEELLSCVRDWLMPLEE